MCLVSHRWQSFSSETIYSRERRKSRYLSYPYTNIGPGHKVFPVKTEDSEAPSHSHQIEGSSMANNRSRRSSTAAKSSKKKLRSKWCRKHIQWSTMSSSQEFINASSSELLFGLYSKAIDCNFSFKGKSDLVEWFFSAYRLSTFRDEAELAAILENQKGGNMGTPVGNGSLNVNGELQEKKKKLEQTRRRKKKSLPSLLDMNKDISTSEFLSGCSEKIKHTRPGESMEDVKPALQLQNVRSMTHEGSSRAKRSLAPKASRSRKTKKIKVSLVDPKTKFFPNLLDGGEKSNKSSSFVIDLQMVPPPSSNIPEKNNGENKVEIGLTGSKPELYASQLGGGGNLDNGFSPMDAQAEHLKTKRATVIPDLNDGGFEDNSTQKKFEGDFGFSPDLNSKHKRMNEEHKSELSRSISSGMEFIQTINYNRMEVSGSCLLLQVNPGASLPSKDDLLAAFCRFGPLNVVETQMSKDGHAQIVFLDDADAEEACRNLKSTHIDHNDPSEPIAPLKQSETIAGHSGSKPPHGDRPSLEFIKQKLEMMASVLEKKGHTISPERRDKLEEEIKTLLEKVNFIGSLPVKD